MADATKTVLIIFEGDESSAEASVGRLSNALGRVQEAEQKLKAESAGAAEAVDKVGAESEQSARQLDKLEQSTSKTKDAAGLMTDAFKAFIVTALTKAFIDANVTAEQLNAAMVSLTGSSASAAKELEYLSNVSQRLGLDNDKATAAFIKLAGATKGTALEGEAAKVVFEAFAGELSKMSKSSADLDRVLEILAKSINSGSIGMRELEQISRIIPGFFDLFARSLGITNEELVRMAKANELGAKELITLANLMNSELSAVKFDSYTAQMNRLRNSISDTFVVLGNAGAWDIFVKGLQAGTAAIVGTVGSLQLLYDLSKTLVDQSLKLSLFSEETGEKMKAAFDKAANSMRPASDALLGVSENTKKVGFDAVAAGKAIESAMNGAGGAAEKTADEILKAFDKTLRASESADVLAKATADLVIAFAGGKISAEQFYSRLDDVQKKQLEMDRAVGGATTRLIDQEAAMKKATAASDKAKESAEKYAIEMEKIASNERIKLIEAKIKLDIAEVEANAKVAIAAFESIDNSIESTGKSLTDLFSLLVGGAKDWATWRELTAQIEKENKRRDDALAKQAELIDMQIALWRAKADALQQGNAMITVDGAGLQPHLEAFMWEILRTIQVRVNADGLEMLVGV